MDHIPITRPRTIPVDWSLTEADAERVRRGRSWSEAEGSWHVHTVEGVVHFHRAAREMYRMTIGYGQRVTSVIAEGDAVIGRHDVDATRLDELRGILEALFGMTPSRLSERPALSFGHRPEADLIAELGFWIQDGLLIDDERAVGVLAGDFGAVIGWIGVSWEGHQPHTQLCDPVHLPFFDDHTLSFAISSAREAYRATLRTCRYCGQEFGPGYLHEVDGEIVCHGCAERHLGFIH